MEVEEGRRKKLFLFPLNSNTYSSNLLNDQFSHVFWSSMDKHMITYFYFRCD